MYLEVMPNGSKYWRFKYRFGGKEKRLAFGVYPDVPLSLARERRADARKLLANDVDPGVVKQQFKRASRENAENSFEEEMEKRIKELERELDVPVDLLTDASYRNARLDPVADIESKIQLGYCAPHLPCQQELLRRVVGGIYSSRLINREFKGLFI